MASFDAAAFDTGAFSAASFSILATLAGIEFPRDAMPTSEQRFQDFIDASGSSVRIGLVDDYKAALATITGLDPDQYSIDDLFKIYWESL